MPHLIATLLLLQSFEVGAWLQSWEVGAPQKNFRSPFAINTIEPNLVDDLFFAFVVFGDPTLPNTKDFRLRISKNDPPLFRELLALKTNDKPRLWLTIGGQNFNNPNDPWGIGQNTHKNFSTMCQSPSSREEFIQSAITTCKTYNFDGIEIDWEYPGVPKLGGHESDFENFLLFLDECRQALLAQGLKLSVALSPLPPSGIDQKYLDEPKLYYEWLASLVKAVDRATLMCYNYHTPQSSPLTGANAPLSRDTDPKSTLFILHSLKACLDAGMPTEKLCLGIPLFGWQYNQVAEMGFGKTFQNGAPLPYFAIADLIAKKKFTLGIDTTTKTAYAANLFENQWISFDIPETVKEKRRVAEELGLKGVVFWSIDQDEYQWTPKFPNVKAAKVD